VSTIETNLSLRQRTTRSSGLLCRKDACPLPTTYIDLQAEESISFRGRTRLIVHQEVVKKLNNKTNARHAMRIDPLRGIASRRALPSGSIDITELRVIHLGRRCPQVPTPSIIGSPRGLHDRRLWPSH